MATTGGNLLQRTRCPYFYDKVTPCNKREPGSGCSAIEGYNRKHAILGISDHCIATHPSDMCVAMAALDAIINAESPNGKRSINFEDFHLLPGNTPDKENSLLNDELITSVEIPPLPFASNSTYIKVRDRSSYEFALTSAAIALELNGDVISDARIALGGVGTKPWRAKDAEQSLKGKKASLETYRAAADIALKDAMTFKYNAFKTELAKRTIIAAFQNLEK
jgi:xanthine dehydrogenase YagS FAD-binding subunit